MKPKIIFLRIPRTASTNFTKILTKLHKGNVFQDRAFKRSPIKQRLRALKEGEYFYDFSGLKPPENIRKYGLIEGHFLGRKYKDLIPEYKMVTFLRDPVERCISHFNINPGRNDSLGIDIRRFAEIYRNFHKIMLGDLSMYSFMGITEEFDRSVRLFYKEFQIPKKFRIQEIKRGVRINKKKRPVSKKDRKYIRELNSEDYELYNEVKLKLKRK